MQKFDRKQHGNTLKRVLQYMLKNYRWSFTCVVLCILGGAIATLYGNMFTHMESLPIRYFDTHAHGDIMSVYTNDVDTLRQLISQSIPQLTNSSVTLVATFISMLVLNVLLTMMAIVMTGVMLLAVSGIGGKSSVYFRQQQKSLGQVNGYIEEMMEGQKVVKVFCHEEKCKDAFKKLNEELRENTCRADQYANIMMPVNGNLANISYVLCAVLGAVLALGGYTGLTLGKLVSFLTLNKRYYQLYTGNAIGA